MCILITASNIHSSCILLVYWPPLYLHTTTYSNSDIDWLAFDRECTAHLPVYARPAFLRTTAAMALTSTFKHQKGDLIKLGYTMSTATTVAGATAPSMPSTTTGTADPTTTTTTDRVEDRVYYYNAKEHTVVPMTAELEQKINSGEIQL